MSTSSRRATRKFTAEFKAEAVAMVEASGGQIAKVARELKLHDSSLGNWVREARELAAGAPTAAERAEIRELRAELGQRLPIRSAADEKSMRNATTRDFASVSEGRLVP